MNTPLSELRAVVNKMQKLPTTSNEKITGREGGNSRRTPRNVHAGSDPDVTIPSHETCTLRLSRLLSTLDNIAVPPCMNTQLSELRVVVNKMNKVPTKIKRRNHRKKRETTSKHNEPFMPDLTLVSPSLAMNHQWSASRACCRDETTSPPPRA